MLPRTSTILTAIVCAALLPEAGAAEPPATIAGTGKASVQVVPTKLRMQVQIEAHGKTRELAIQRLKARREAVAENMSALGAENKSVKFGVPSVKNVIPTPSVYGTPGPILLPSPVPYAPPASFSIPTPIAPTDPPGRSTYVPSGSVPVLPPATTAPPTLTPASTGSSPEATPDVGPRPAATVPTTTPTPPTFGSPYAPVYAQPAPVSPTTPPSGSTPSPTSTYGPPGSNPIIPGAPTQQRASRPAVSAELYAATSTLTIEWPLQADTVEQAMLAGEAIRKKIAAAGDLLGGKAAEKLPADEQELLDEQSGLHETRQTISRPVVETLSGGQQAVRYVTEEVVSASGGVFLPVAPGAPSFQYVATISSPQRKALMAEAFGNAKSQAADLAEATGGKLGTVRSVSGDVSNFKPNNRFMDVYTPTPAPLLLSPEESSNETMATCPGGLRFYAKVHALFRRE
jgi:hypothetical protein